MVTRRDSAALGALGAVLIAAATAGCADLRRPEAQAVAEAFTRADGAGRCALLAPATVAALEHDEGQPCAEALRDLQLPGGTVTEAQVWGDNALVRLTGDTVFLTSTEQGWKVAAAGCAAQAEGPYLCRVEA